MTTYRYIGKSTAGAITEGIVEAFDRQDALIKARQHCHVLVKLEPVPESPLRRMLDMGSLLSGGKFRPKTLALLCSQLSIELKAGLPLVSCLELVTENSRDQKLRRLLKEVTEDVRAGNTLADSFALRTSGLPRTFLETIRAGEESGKLDECFSHLQRYYEDAHTVSSKIAGAMVYPAMLLAVAALVLTVILIFAVPVFEDSFSAMGRALPLPTRILTGVSHLLTQNWPLLLALLAAAGTGFALYRKTEPGRRFLARMALTFPGIGQINRMKAAAQFSSTLSTMLRAGLPLVQAARITAATVENLLIREDMDAAVRGMIEGRALEDGLRKSAYLPGLLLEMTAVGEKTGHLEDTLEVVSAYYTREVDSALKQALEILNPCITIALAVAVVFILLAVYLPIFGMYGSL